MEEQTEEQMEGKTDDRVFLFNTEFAHHRLSKKGDTRLLLFEIGIVNAATMKEELHIIIDQGLSPEEMRA